MRPQDATSKCLTRLCANGRAERDIGATAPDPEPTTAKRLGKSEGPAQEGMGRPWGLLSLNQT